MKHRNYLGVELDPLIEAVTTKLVPAVGGILTITGCETPPALEVQLLQGGTVVARATVRANGVYFIPDLAAGEYLWQVVDATSEGAELAHHHGAGGSADGAARGYGRGVRARRARTRSSRRARR